MCLSIHELQAVTIKYEREERINGNYRMEEEKHVEA